MEEDYLSDHFIADNAIPSRPMPVPKTLPLSSLMEESRTKYVSTPLQPSSKGFQLLSRLGYQGGGLGRSSQGTTEPINVIAGDVRKDVSGVGVREAKKRKIEAKNDAKRQQLNLQQSMMLEFKQQQSRKSIASKSNAVLKSCLRIICELDGKTGTSPADADNLSVNDVCQEYNLDDAIEVHFFPSQYFLCTNIYLVLT